LKNSTTLYKAAFLAGIVFFNCFQGEYKLSKCKQIYTGYRIQFANLPIQKENEMNDSLNYRIDQWWKSFLENKDEIIANFNCKSDFNVSAFMNKSLHCIHPQLMYEYGPAISKKGYRLVITPESRKDLRPLTNKILDKAPVLPDWEFYPYRLPEDFEMAKEAVKARTGGSIDDLLVLGIINAINGIDLMFIRKGIKSETQKKQAFNDAFVGLETLAGEEILDKWIGSIDVVGQIPKGEQPIYMKGLKFFIDEKISRITDSLPSKPYYEFSENTEWTGYELKPDEKDEYPSQEDLLIMTTMVPKAFQNFHSGQLFYSQKFSRFNETFIYVKIDEWHSFHEKDPQWKEKLRAKINTELCQKKVGTDIGSGTGRRYSYMDFACIDIPQSVEIIRKNLQLLGVSKRSWILFYDSDLCSEWIGIWPDSPPPPVENYEIQEAEGGGA
jgi:hypothetical protein